MAESADVVDRQLRELGERLARGVEAALQAWVESCVERIYTAWRGDLPPQIRGDATEAGLEAAEQVGYRLGVLLSADVDDQPMNPLQLLREAVIYPTSVLRSAGVPEVVRDRFLEQNSPNDIYGLEPAGFADIDPGLHELGITWGAAKARAHLRRHHPPN